MSSESGIESSQRNVLDLIRDLQQKRITGNSLMPADRQACVAYLTGEGYTVAESAQILGVCDRTVLRDRRAVRESNSLHADEKLLGVMAGRLLEEAESAAARLNRVARDPKVKPEVRVEADRARWTVIKELVQTLQRLGHLPTAAIDVRTHSETRLHATLETSVLHYHEIAAEAARLSAIIAESGTPDPEYLREIEEVRDRADRGQLQERLRLARGSLPRGTGYGGNENDHE